jgi:hypothetical protein
MGQNSSRRLSQAFGFNFKLSILSRRMKSVWTCFLLIIAWAASANAAEISNDTVRLQLGVTSQGIPIIESATWTATGQAIFQDGGTPEGLGNWVQDGLVPEDAFTPAAEMWQVVEGDSFITAEATRDLAKGLKITWIIEIPRQGALFRLRVRIENASIEAQSVKEFPAWNATWKVNNQAAWVRWWEALKFVRFELPLATGSGINLGSRLHSSDDDQDGVNPYWIVGGSNSRLYFGLEWCGGWDAKLKATDGGFNFAVRLPSAETQLVLGASEAMEGPALLVVPTAGPDEMNNRNAWMMQRLGLGQLLYGGPQPTFPLTYNHWYAKGFDVDAAFLNQQVEALTPYGFNAFIVDAGWYEHVGDWHASAAKFQPYELERMLHRLKKQGITAGLWSCPQFESANGDNLPLFVDEPPSYTPFIDAYLLDLSGEEFDTLLPGHVNRLRKRFSMGWWKYDQAFFVADSRAGAMRNVVAFQNGLRATRQANPDLTIENCQSGGRMLNELTLLATQISWLRDSNDAGFSQARQNISTALGALEFVFPWSAYRWTNTFDKMDVDDDELTRLYCRSAMAGVWGISSDLTKISDRQRAVILGEIENYRRLNEIKQSCWYDLQLPTDNADVAAVAFYDDQAQKVGVLVYRWNRNGAFDQRLMLPHLNPKTKYRVMDVDAGATNTVKGKKLKKEGMTVSFSAERQSALLFIEPAN